ELDFEHPVARVRFCRPGCKAFVTLAGWSADGYEGSTRVASLHEDAPIPSVEHTAASYELSGPRPITTVVFTSETLGTIGGMVLDDLEYERWWPADFDNSGGTPDTQDLEAFFTAWSAGDALSDVDQSGGTPDGEDIAAFFGLWLAGGC